MISIPTATTDSTIVKNWLNKHKKRFGDDWKLVIWKLLDSDTDLATKVHPLVTKHLARKKP